MTERNPRVFVLGEPQGHYVQRILANCPPGLEVLTANFSSIQCTLSGPARRSTTPVGPAGRALSDETFSIADTTVSPSDLILVRSMSTGTLESIVFRMDALARIEQQGTLVLNPAKSLELAIDKYLSLARLAAMGIPIPPTHVCQTTAEAMNAFMELGQNVVVKPLFGSEGRGLIHVADPDHAWRVFRSIEAIGGVIYQQKFVGPGGRDYRMLMIGSKSWIIERTHSSDWRTNHARGGHCSPSELPSYVRNLARQISQQLQLPIVGIDWIFDHQTERFLLLEVNGVPGWNGVETAYGVNIAQELWSFVQQKWPAGG